MKKIVTLLAFFIGALVMVNGQGELRFGFQLSPTFGWLSTDVNTIESNGSNLGLKLGMVGEYYFQENYSVTSGIGFYFNAGGRLLHERPGVYWAASESPCSEDFANTTTGPDLKYSVQYVEIPVGLKMRTREFGYLRYYFQPELGLGFRTQAVGNVEKSPNDACEDLNIQEEVGLLNVFWGVGGGVEYSVSESTSIVAGIATQFGFTDFTKDNDTVIRNASTNETTDEDSKGVMRAVIIRLGVLF